MAYILILGAKSDIAKALADEYAKEGYDLYLAARNHHELDNDVNDLKIRYEIDVKNLEFDALACEKHQHFWESLNPKPLGVICVFGYLGDQKEGEQDFTVARRILDTNFTGCVSILNIAANHLEKEKKGFIIGISSVAGERGRPSNYLYGSAKAGFTAYLSGLRARLFKSGVHVLTVKPGFVYTKMTEGMDLPGAITAKPEEVARDTIKAQRKGKNVLYTKWYWGWILRIVKCIPEFVFKRMNS
ncbi:SDR family oxidoreductase [bacterium]|nr:SDR family oxidoreductase [bacterium]